LTKSKNLAVPVRRDVAPSLRRFVASSRRRYIEAMLALLSAWLGALFLGFSIVAAFYSPALNRYTIIAALWGPAAAMTLASLVLWSLRHEPPTTPVRMQRVQAGVGIGLSLLAVIVVYVLIGVRSEPTPISPAASGPPAVLLSCPTRCSCGT
jgi:hypothetical protein